MRGFCCGRDHFLHELMRYPSLNHSRNPNADHEIPRLPHGAAEGTQITESERWRAVVFGWIVVVWSPGCARHRGPYVRPGPAAETKQFRLPYDRRSRKKKFERRGVITHGAEGEGGGVGGLWGLRALICRQTLKTTVRRRHIRPPLER